MDETADCKNPFIPYEVVTIILGHTLPYKSIFQCRLVCRTWKHIVDHESWKYVVELGRKQRKPYSDVEIGKISRLPFFILHAMCAKDGIFGRNFVMTKHRSGNPFWKLTDPVSPCWQIVPRDENELSNSDDFFSFKMQVGKLQTSSKMHQIIKLPKCGLSWLIIKELRPKIVISLWVCLEDGLRGSADGPKYHVVVSLRNADLVIINENSPEKPNQLRSMNKGDWKKVTIPKQRASELRQRLDSILIEHQLFNSQAKCTITRIVVRIQKPNLLNVDWNSILEPLSNTVRNPFKVTPMSPIAERSTYSPNLLPTFEPYFDLLAFPESNIFVPGVWYGRPLGDVIKLKDEDVETSICYDNTNYLLLYELRCRLCLSEYGLYDFVMDESQPRIQAYIDNDKTHRDQLKYEMTVSLLDADGKILHQKEESQLICRNESKMMSLEFEKYGPGVRYVVFNIRRHLSMNKCTQVVHGPLTFTFLNHVRSVINACRVSLHLPQFLP